MLVRSSNCAVDRRATVLAALLLSISVLPGAALTAAEQQDAVAAPPSEGLSITIYNAPRQTAVPFGRQRLQVDAQDGYGYGRGTLPGGWAVVKMRRKVDLPKGRGEVRVSDVAASLIPASVFCESLSDPQATTVLEQNYLYDLASAQALLERYVDREIVLVPEKGSGLLAGRLLSPQGLLLHVDGEPEPVRLATYRELRLPRLPEGLLTRPTLVWQVQSAKAGEQLLEITYLCDHITWRADYTLLLGDSGETLDLSGWATVENQSGATYPRARLKLMGGDVQKLAEPELAGAGVCFVSADEVSGPEASAL